MLELLCWQICKQKQRRLQQLSCWRLQFSWPSLLQELRSWQEEQQKIWINRLCKLPSRHLLRIILVSLR